jgi:hypothetical protein
LGFNSIQRKFKTYSSLLKDFQATSAAGCERFQGRPGGTPHVAGNLSRFQRWAKRLVGAKTTQKQTEVTVETDRVLIIRRRLTKRGWCRDCGCEVDMVELSEVQALTNRSQLELRDGSLSKKWHFSEDLDGAPLVCLESLLKSL